MGAKQWGVGALLGVLMTAFGAVATGGVATASTTASAAPEVLVYVKSGAVYASSLTGVGAHQILSGAEDVKVNRQGTVVAFSDTASGKVGVANIDGTDRQVLSATGAPTGWSPDGTRLLVVRSGSHDYAWVTIATSAVAPIPESDPTMSSPVTTPDSTLLWGDVTQLAATRQDGSGFSVVRTIDNYPTAVSSDGSRLLSCQGPGAGCTVSDTLTGLHAVTRVMPVTDAESMYAYPAGSGISADGTQFFIGLEYNQDDKVRKSYPIGIYRFSATSSVVTTVIAGVDDFSIGGGAQPVDTDGTPPAVTGLTNDQGIFRWTPPTVADFAGVDVRYAEGTTAPSSPTSGSDGGRVLTPETTVPGMQPGHTFTVAVFARDWFGNVAPPATRTVTVPSRLPTALTVSTSSFDTWYGNSIAMAGTLVRTWDGAPVAGQTISLSRRAWPTQNPYAPLGTGTTDAKGQVLVNQIPGISYDYHFSFAGNSSYFAAAFDKRIRIGRPATYYLDHSTATAGSKVSFRAQVHPSAPIAKTYLQQNVNNIAKTLGPHNTDANGWVVYTITAPAKGKTDIYRIQVAGTGNWITWNNPWVSITGR